MYEFFDAVKKGAQSGFNEVFNDSLFFFQGLNWEIILGIFKRMDIEISGGNNKESSKWSINQYKLAIACFALNIRKFDIGFNFHNVDFESKINKGYSKSDRLNNLLKRRFLKLKSAGSKKEYSTLSFKEIRKGNNYNLSDFSLINDEFQYLEKIKEERNIRYSRGDRSWKDYELGSLDNKDNWINNMKKVFSTFNEGQTYTVLFRCITSNNIITL